MKAFFRKQNIRLYNTRSILLELPFELRSQILQHLYKDLIEQVWTLRTPCPCAAQFYLYPSHPIHPTLA